MLVNEGLFRLGISRLASVELEERFLTWIWQNLKFDSFRPKVLKTLIAQIPYCQIRSHGQSQVVYSDECNGLTHLSQIPYGKYFLSLKTCPMRFSILKLLRYSPKLEIAWLVYASMQISHALWTKNAFLQESCHPVLSLSDENVKNVSKTYIVVWEDKAYKIFLR